MDKINFKPFLYMAIAGMYAGCQSTAKNGRENQRTEKPNIIVIVSDDHGTNDAGCYGNTAIKTPNIDYLASEGMKFTNAYCTSASCSASRSVILTGLYNHANGHYGHKHHFHHFSAFDHIKSLPVLLDDIAGYETARIGKYHVGPEKVFHFETVLNADLRNPVAMADSCLDFISANKENPFFLYYCTGDPHRGGGKVEDNPYNPDRFGNKDEGYSGVEKITFSPDDVIVPDYLPNTPECRAELAQYYQSVARLDQGIGRLFKHLKAHGVWDNSIVIYISDNGIAFPGAKTNVYEPGIKLPCIIKNVNSKNKGTTNNAKINWADLAPTLLDYAGGLSESRDILRKRWEENKNRWDNTYNKDFHGHSFKEVLENNTSEGWDTVYASHTFHEITMYYPMRTIVTDKYKLIWNIAHELPYPHASDLWESSTWQSALNSKDKMYAFKPVDYYSNRPEFELFDLKNDPQESKNLAGKSEYEETLAELKDDLRAFQKRTNDPWLVKWEHE